MSINTALEVPAPQKPSIVQVFAAAPTLVKVLAASLYLPALLYAAQGITAITHGELEAADLGFFALQTLILVVIPFLLGKGIARGAHGSWRLTLALSVLGLLYDLVQVTAGLTASSGTNVVIAGAIVGLLFAPVVRRHCAKK